MPIIRTQLTSIGTPVLNGTSRSVLFLDTSTNLAQDNTAFNFNSSTDTLIITNISGTNLISSTATTPPTANSSTAVATTAFVQTNLGAYIPMTSGGNFAKLDFPNTFTSFNTFRDLRFSANNTYNIGTTTVRPSGMFIGASGLDVIGNVNVSGNISLGGTLTGFANLTGNSTATTQTLGTDNTTIATTAFVRTYVSNSGGAGGGGDVYLANNQTFTGVNTFRDIRFSNTTFYLGTHATRPSGVFVGLSGINSQGPIYQPTPSGADSSTLSATTDYVKTVISGARTGSFGFGFPSGTFVAGMQTLSILCPTARVIRGITLLGEGSGSCAIDVWRVPYGTYPMGSANTIFTGVNRAVIISGVKNRDTTLSTLINTNINRFDTLKAVVTSVTPSGLTGVSVIFDTFVE